MIKEIRCLSPLYRLTKPFSPDYGYVGNRNRKSMSIPGVRMMIDVLRPRRRLRVNVSPGPMHGLIPSMHIIEFCDQYSS